MLNCLRAQTVGEGERGEEEAGRGGWVDGQIKKGQINKIGQRCIQDPYHAFKKMMFMFVFDYYFFVLTMDHKTTCIIKKSLVVMNPQYTCLRS